MEVISTNQNRHVERAEPGRRQQTGVVVLRMGLPNPDRLLLPGMYVRVEHADGIAKMPFHVPARGTCPRPSRAPLANGRQPPTNGGRNKRQLTVATDAVSDWIVQRRAISG